MATSREVLGYLIPNGGYVLRGSEYEGIEFIEATPITKAEFTAGFAQYDAWKAQQDSKTETDKAALLEKLSITADEAKLLLS